MQLGTRMHNITAAFAQYLCKSHFVSSKFFHVCNKSRKILEFVHSWTKNHNLRFSVHFVTNLNVHYIL